VEQTATALGITPGTVKSQTSHAMNRLRSLLGDAVIPEGAHHG
jgi:DNA-directed RNA polymerase specialized sigma24 family protein